MLKCLWFKNAASPIYDTKLRTDEDKSLVVPYENLKTQCAFKLQDPVQQRKISLLADIPDEEKQAIVDELDVLCEVDFDNDKKKKIISKDDIKKKLWRSPDWLDIFIMRNFFELPRRKKKLIIW